MPYFAAGRVVIVTPEEARTIAETGDIEVALSKDVGLDVMDIDAALFFALRSLARERAPQALRLFTSHWAVSDRGRNHVIEGDHADLLGGEALASALAAIDALLLECRMHPERISALLEAADLPHGMHAASAEADLREAASRAAPNTLTEATKRFEADFPGDHLSAAGLHAWLLAFAAWLRHAQATGEVAVHIAMF